MILWTVMPPELVFEGIDKAPGYEEVEYNGVRLQVERLSPLQCRIVRLLTTEPSDYLRNDLQPGALLTYRPSLELH